MVIGFRGKSGAKVRDMAAVQRYLDALKIRVGETQSPASSPPTSPRSSRSQSPMETNPNAYDFKNWTRVFNTREMADAYVSPGGKHIVYHRPLKRGENNYLDDDYQRAKEADSDPSMRMLVLGPGSQYRLKGGAGKRKTKKQARRRKKTRRTLRG